MVMIRKSTALFLGAIALVGAGLTIAGQASAKPFKGHHGHGFHRHYGYHPLWRGHVGPRFVHSYGGGYRCRMVRRVNAYGEIVLRRVCFNPYY